MKLQFLPEDPADARGRNGEFRVEEITLHEYDVVGQFELRAWAHRKGYRAPLTLAMSATDFWRLAAEIQKVTVSKVVLLHPERPL